MKKLKAYVIRNKKKIKMMGTWNSKAQNLMVHISNVNKYRMKDLEKYFWDNWYTDKIK
jgi:hypothetical protein